MQRNCSKAGKFAILSGFNTTRSFIGIALCTSPFPACTVGG